MAVKNPQFEINIRKNTNANNPGYGKYYPKAVEKETISLRGLCNHMAEHNSIYGRDIIQGVLMKMSSCISELLSQGALLEGKWNANTYVKGIHIRFKPEGSAEDKITSVAFKDLCSLATYGVEEKVDLTPEETDPTKKQYIKKVTPLEDWIAEQKAQNP